MTKICHAHCPDGDAGFWVGVAAAAVGMAVVVVVYGRDILRVLGDVLVVAGIVLGVLAVAGAVAGVMVWRWRHATRRVAAQELAEVPAKAVARDAWPFVRPDGTPIELPERGR